MWLGLAVLSFDAAIGPVAFALGFGVDFFGVLLTIDFFEIAIADSSGTWIWTAFVWDWALDVPNPQLCFQLAHNVHLRNRLTAHLDDGVKNFIVHR